MAVSRDEVVQSALDLFNEPRYLEVGVAGGVTFHALRAKEKTAVDPLFRFDMDEAKAAQPECNYFQMPSDDFFAQCPFEQKFDVIYLDGLHTFEQTLRDLMNSLSHILDDSVIVIDDIFPSSIAAALPDIAEFRKVREHLGIKRGAWMGDVYKLVMFVDTFMQTWDFRCVQDNHGQLIMWQKPRAEVTQRVMSDIGFAGYERAILQRDSFNFMPLAQIIEAIKASRAN